MDTVSSSPSTWNHKVQHTCTSLPHNLSSSFDQLWSQTPCPSQFIDITDIALLYSMYKYQTHRLHLELDSSLHLYRMISHFVSIYLGDNYEAPFYYFVSNMHHKVPVAPINQFHLPHYPLLSLAPEKLHYACSSMTVLKRPSLWVSGLLFWRSVVDLRYCITPWSSQGWSFSCNHDFVGIYDIHPERLSTSRLRTACHRSNYETEEDHLDFGYYIICGLVFGHDIWSI